MNLNNNAEHSNVQADPIVNYSIEFEYRPQIGLWKCWRSNDPTVYGLGSTQAEAERELYRL